IWSPYAGPARGFGPRRMHSPPIELDALPSVNVVVISHDHYDHLDMFTSKELFRRGARFIVPLGVGAHLESWGISPAAITELAWWEQSPPLGSTNVRVVSTPARHTSGRKLWGVDRTLWSGWALVGPRHRVFYSGDTGYHPEFKTIAQRLGPFDVALLEVGQ